MAGLPSFPWMAPREPVPWCRTALARDASLQGAVDGVARQLAGAAEADLALVFASASFASDLPRLLPCLRQLQPRLYSISSSPLEHPQRVQVGGVGVRMFLCRM